MRRIKILCFLSFRSLSPTSKTAPLTNPPSHNPSRLGPTWLTEKPSTPTSFSSTSSTSSPSPSRPASTLPSAAKDSQTSLVSKPTASQTTCESTFTTTTSITTRPTPAPRTSTTAAKTVQSKLKYFQSDNNANNANDNNEKTTTTNTDINNGPNVTGKVQQATVGQAVTVVVNVGGTGKKEVNVSLNTNEEKNKAAVVGGDSGKVCDSSKTKAAAFISTKLAEENINNNSKPSWVTVALKKTDK